MVNAALLFGVSALLSEIDIANPKSPQFTPRGPASRRSTIANSSF